MEHLAIMRKSWGLTGKILTGQKVIESRWYATKRQPWNRITKGDGVYFKNSGEPVTLTAKVSKVLQFANLTPQKVKTILNRYGQDDGIERADMAQFFERFKNKKYCLLIFLTEPRAIKPFGVDKTGFGAMAAWITVAKIARLKKKL